jgi:hypothetical protein
MYRARSRECLFTHTMTKVFVLLTWENTLGCGITKELLLIHWEEKKKSKEMLWDGKKIGTLRLIELQQYSNTIAIT